MKKLHKIFFCLFLSLFTLSCSKWVDVKPTDRLGEDQLFVDPAGYTKAINGVYVEMANMALYGQEMTTGAVDVMAQYTVIMIILLLSIQATGSRPHLTMPGRNHSNWWPTVM